MGSTRAASSYPIQLQVQYEHILHTPLLHTPLLAAILSAQDWTINPQHVQFIIDREIVTDFNRKRQLFVAISALCLHNNLSLRYMAVILRTIS